jgi:type IV pilus assembly protein PilE
MKRHAGFTLVELLVVLAIVAVLVAAAYPNYAGYITKTRRIEGQVALVELMQQQERFFTQNNTYVAFSSGSSDPQETRFKWWSGSAASSSAYELRGRACPGYAIAQCVELQATPGTAKVDARFRDGDCETLTLNSAGERTSSGASDRCWP